VSTTVQVLSATQRIVVDPATSSVSVVNAGPVGPPGASGAFSDAVRSETIVWLTPITQEEWESLPTPRDPTIMYVIGDF
jgi:hypothetical protein